MNDRIAIVREATTKLTQMLAGVGVTVTQRGVRAYVTADIDGRPILVNIPFIPDNATEQLVDAIQGFLDHEVAHILFTDFKALAKVSKDVFGVVNVVEDTRIEREMALKFKGSATNLSNTGTFFLEKYIEPRLKKAKDVGDEEEMIASLMVPLIRAMSGQFVFKEYMKAHEELMRPVVNKIGHLASEVENVKSTDEAIEVAKKILKKLKADEPPKCEAPETKASTKSSKSKKTEKSKPESKAEPGEPSEDKEDETGEGETGEGEDEPGEGETGEGEPGEGESGEEEESKGESERGSSPSEDDGRSVASDEPSAPSKDDEGSEGRSVSAALLKKIDSEMKEDFDSALSKIITSESIVTTGDSEYVIYTKDYDVVEPLPVGKAYASSMLTSLEDEVMHMVGPLQKDLERAISARSLSTYSSGHRSGRLHSANLSRLMVGDNRVFRKKHEATSKDVAVELVVDMSGSMGSGGKVHLAAIAAFALSMVLERIGISHEVICFTTGASLTGSHELKKEAMAVGSFVRYSRTEAIYMPILKGFNERLTIKSKERFAWLPRSSCLRNNIDGESVEIAARRLLSRKETGKVMIVLSDGAPYAAGVVSQQSDYLRKVVKNVTKAGVSVVGIGIMSDAVKKYYPKCVVMNDAKDLPEIVMKQLRGLIVK